MDLVACLAAPVKLESLDRAVIPTGIAIALPPGYEAQIRARSSLPAKHGVIVGNGPGTIDADYRGEIGVILINASKETFIIEHGMRVAQMMVSPVDKVEWNKKDHLDETARGVGGYGSTGI